MREPAPPGRRGRRAAHPNPGRAARYKSTCPPGRPFLPRCPMRRPHCDAEEPPLLAVAGVDHAAACHYAEELAGKMAAARCSRPPRPTARPSSSPTSSAPWRRSRPRLTSRTAAPQADPGGHPARPPCSWARRPRGSVKFQGEELVGKTRKQMRSVRRDLRAATALLSAVPILGSQAKAPAAPHRARGRRPQPGNPPSSCRFPTPLLEAQDICAEQEPALVDRGRAIRWPATSPSRTDCRGAGLVPGDPRPGYRPIPAPLTQRFSGNSQQWGVEDPL
jgi:hypothetical protein